MKNKLIKRINYGNTKRRKSAGIPGYLTVEAALIVPIAFFFVLLVVHISFFSYLACISNQDALMLAIRSTTYGYAKHGKDYIYADAETYVNSVLDEQMSNKYFATNSLSVDVSESGREVNVLITGEADASTLSWSPINPAILWEYRGSMTSTGYNRGEKIRRAARIVDMVKAGKDFISGGGGTTDPSTEPDSGGASPDPNSGGASP